MSLKICRYCSAPTIVPGPRNAKIVGCCLKCRWKGLLELAQEDMITGEEANELQVERQIQV